MSGIIGGKSNNAAFILDIKDIEDLTLGSWIYVHEHVCVCMYVRIAMKYYQFNEAQQ